ncbi:MAG: MBOAT family protein [Ruminococcus sp.]|nr:MBOAT family protein [Ruminococcus sp.]
MIFADLFFLYIFLPICLIFYFVCKKTVWRNLVLIVFSLIFYAWGEPICVCLLVFSALVDYINGRMIDRYRGKLGAKLALASSLIINLGLLFVFKYLGFFVENLNYFTGLSILVPSIELPIGISFYTFQTISYTIDCYWGKVKTQRSFLNFLMYVSLFPQLVAGPIVRYATVEQEINCRHTTALDISEGISRICIGLGKKVLIADNLSLLVTGLFGDSSSGYAALSGLSAVGTWYGAIAVGLWYYFDFSGYSDIAIGLGRIFGFHFNENFNHPFMCRNITEFWQRWHISLGSFFRDYLFYLPIFGKRRQYLNLFLVWFCTGLWHGASWNFIIWGLYWGVFILIETKIGKKRLKKIPAVITHIYSKLVITIGFGIFYFESFDKLGLFFKNLVCAGGNKLIDSKSETLMLQYIFLMAAAVLLSFPVIDFIKKLASKFKTSYYIVNGAGVICNGTILVLSSIMLVTSTVHPFLYFRF